jgi:hypothetical protein
MSALGIFLIDVLHINDVIYSSLIIINRVIKASDSKHSIGLDSRTQHQL